MFGCFKVQMHSTHYMLYISYSVWYIIYHTLYTSICDKSDVEWQSLTPFTCVDCLYACEVNLLFVMCMSLLYYFFIVSLYYYVIIIILTYDIRCAYTHIGESSSWELQASVFRAGNTIFVMYYI